MSFKSKMTAEEITTDISLSGKTILLTGCNSGIGQEALRVFQSKGAQVVALARSLEKAKAICEKFSGQLIPMECELSDPQSVQNCVKEIQQKGLQLDVILCNAGIMTVPNVEHALGIELQFLTNHIGHFILVTGLLEQLKNQGRVVMVSSSAHKLAPRGLDSFDHFLNPNGKSYRGWAAYGQSKMANLLFSKELARRFQGTDKTANAVHPGVIPTNLGRHMVPTMNPISRTLLGSLIGPIFFKTVAQGAATGVFAAVHPSLNGISGAYFKDCKTAFPRTDANHPEYAKRLWDISERIVGRLLRN